MEKNNQSFLLGIVSAVAIIAVVALIYVLSSGGLNNLRSDGDSDRGSGKTAKKFEECFKSDKFDDKIKADQALGTQLGVRGTPATFINGYLLSGSLPFEAVKQVIDTILAGEEPDFDFLKDKTTGEIVKVDMPQIDNDDHQKGAKNGQILFLEFSDFECPFCARFAPTVKQVEDTYGDSVTIVYKHFPLNFHPLAKPAAIASECAAEQGKFWEMHDKMFELSTDGDLSEKNIKKAGAEIGLK